MISFLLFTSLFIVASCGENDNATPEAEPPSLSVAVDLETIQLGESTTLSWSSTGADSCDIEPRVGSVAADGSIALSPTQTTTYTITATGPGGTATASITVTVIHPAPSASISADQTSIMTGETALLSWSSAHADSAVIDNGIGAVSVNGSTTVSPAATTSYTIRVAGPGGTATGSVTVNVNNSSPVIISAAPITIEQGGSSTLSWTSANAWSAHIDNGIGVVPVNGSITVYPDHTTTYTISVIGVAGSASPQAVVTVMGKLPKQMLKAGFLFQ